MIKPQFKLLEIKNTMDGINRLDNAEKISKSDDTWTETIQNETDVLKRKSTSKLTVGWFKEIYEHVHFLIIYSETSVYIIQVWKRKGRK